MTDSYQQTNFIRSGVTVVRADRKPWSHTIELAMWHQDGRSTYVAQPVTMSLDAEATNPGQARVEAFVKLGQDQAQQLMDELYRCGVRPTEGAGSVGQLGAVQAHLADMRRLVFDAPNVVGGDPVRVVVRP